MAAKHRTLHDLLLHHLRDLHGAEKHAAKILGKMTKAAASDAVRQALESRQTQADARLETLDGLFEALDKRPHAAAGEAMQGLVEETKALLDDFDDSPAIDAGIIAAVQAIDHYALARYAAIRLWAAELCLTALAAPLDAILAETRQALDRWAALAGGAASPAPTAATTVLTLKGAALMGLR